MLVAGLMLVCWPFVSHQFQSWAVLPYDRTLSFIRFMNSVKTSPV